MRFRIYLRSTNEAISDRPNSKIPALVKLYTQLLWIDNKWLIVRPALFTKYGEGPSYLLNVESGEVRKSPNEVITHYEGDQVVVYNDDEDKFKLEHISEMEFIKPNDLPEADPIKIYTKEELEHGP